PESSRGWGPPVRTIPPRRTVAGTAWICVHFTETGVTAASANQGQGRNERKKRGDAERNGAVRSGRGRRARDSASTGRHPRCRRQVPEALHAPDAEDRTNGEEHEDALPAQHRLEGGNEPECEEGQEEAQTGLKRQRRSHVAGIGELADGGAELGA